MRAHWCVGVLVLGCSGSPDIVARAHDDFDPNHPPVTLALSGDLLVHDPSVIEAAGVSYLFSSGDGIVSKTSTDFLAWQAAPRVFTENPSWIAEKVPGASALWSPDIAYFDGSFHIYYAASTFGSARSCIGHATSAKLGAEASWVNRGAVVCSNVGDVVEPFNAIDPDVFLDHDGAPYLAFGSFDSGLKLVALDPTGSTTSGSCSQSLPAKATATPFKLRRWSSAAATTTCSRRSICAATAPTARTA
ncbi:MAG: family 43 glycosylhydrolase [Aquabacterium sp.]